MEKIMRLTRLEMERRSRGLGGQALAQLAGVHLAEVSAVENRRALPRPGFRKAVAEALDMLPEELFADFPDRIPLRGLDETGQSVSAGE